MAEVRWRAIVDNDFSGDPDGLVALAHIMLTTDVRTELITTTPVDPGLARLAGIDPSASAGLAAKKVHEILDAMGREGIDVVAGAETLAHVDEWSAAARAIVSVASADSDVPLAILCGGPLTNVAAALALEPRIRDRAVLVWIGGSDDGAPEYNRDTDAKSAADVLGSGIPMVQVPLQTYERMKVSLAEVSHDLATASPLGAWLAERLLDVPPFVTLHGILTVGDSALASVVALDPAFGPEGGRIVADIDMRLLWGDFLAKLRLARAASAGSA